MKNAITICALLISVAANAQDDQTLFSDVQRVGAWGGPIFEYTNLDKDVTAVSGGGGALVLDDFYLGGYGMGDAEYSISSPGSNLKERVRFKHGGLWLGYTPMQRRVIHPYTSVKFGWGKARYKASKLDDPGTVLNELNDNIFVLAPEFGIEINIFSFFRIAATGTYRWVNGVDDVPNFNDDDFSSFGASLTLRFGGFGNDWNWDD